MHYHKHTSHYLCGHARVALGVHALLNAADLRGSALRLRALVVIEALLNQRASCIHHRRGARGCRLLCCCQHCAAMIFWMTVTMCNISMLVNLKEKLVT